MDGFFAEALKDRVFAREQGSGLTCRHRGNIFRTIWAHALDTSTRPLESGAEPVRPPSDRQPGLALCDEAAALAAEEVGAITRDEPAKPDPLRSVVRSHGRSPRGNDADHAALFERYVRIANLMGYEVTQCAPEDMPDGLLAFTDSGPSKRISLDRSLSPLQRVVTMGDDLGHVFGGRDGNLFENGPELVHHYAAEIGAQLLSRIAGREVPVDRMLDHIEGLHALGLAPIEAYDRPELSLSAYALLTALDAVGMFIVMILSDPDAPDSALTSAAAP